MAPTRTDTPRAARRRRRRRIRAGLFAATVILPLAGLAVAGGGSSGGRPASTALAAAEHLAPDRASRSGLREEEPAPPTAVTVVADGSSRDVFVPAATVGELLAGLGIALDGDDEVTPPRDAAPGRAVTVVRVEVSRVTEERVVPAPKELLDDPALPRGVTRVDADGAPGRERVVFEVVRRDGRITGKRQITTETLTPASPRVVVVGRGGGRGAPTDDEDVPLKLRIARGEDVDGGGPPEGRPAGGSGPTRRIAASSGPPANGQQEGGASWYRYKAGTCAHRTLPKGTVVTVTNLASGKTATCTVADRGPFIAGRIIDLDRSVFMAIADSPGQGVLRVRIEW